MCTFKRIYTWQMKSKTKSFAESQLNSQQQQVGGHWDLVQIIKKIHLVFFARNESALKQTEQKETKTPF